MILIKELTKKYKTKNRRICTALDKVSLTLPDSGMVFIIGKSGSGKSTLLNMIGGLDGFDGGAIIADGNDMSRFKDKDFYKFRASYVGFVFQDYHLIEELTVEENVRLATEIANVDGADIDSALGAVDLSGYGQRYPDELSGGQKQRVAIARALIKSPRVLLCDEPTGNLDNNTSTQIMDLLKEISRERLVLIVSHNMSDAQKYADRLIELSDGRIISDLTKREGYRNELCITDGTLTLPYNHNLTDEEAETVFGEISSGKVKRLVQNDSGYKTTEVMPESGRRAEIRASKMKLGSIAGLFAAFSSVGRLRTAITAFICAVMVVLLIIFQSFLMFNGSDAIMQSIGDDAGGTIVLKKDRYFDRYGNVNQTKIYRVSEDDLEKIDQLNGVEAKKYLLYNYAIPVNLANRPSLVESEKNFKFNFGSKHIFSPQMPGTLVCDVDYLTNHFGKDGVLTVLAGDVYESQSSAGVIITDYMADAMMVFNPLKFRSYNDVICEIYDESSHKWGNIVAVIETGYKDKYSDVINRVAENVDVENVGLDTLDGDVAVDLVDDIKTNLSIGYSINPDFLSEAVREENKNYARMVDTVLTCEGGRSTTLETGTTVSENYAGVNLSDGEMLLTVHAMRELFPEISNDNFTFPVNLTVEQYEFPNAEGELLYQKSFTVTGLANYITISEGDFEEYKEIDIIPYSVYVENPDDPGSIIDGMEENYFTWNSTDGTAITLLNKSVNMFFDLFRMIELMILAMTVVFVISHSIRSVKSNFYQIGVIKAIGGRSSDIGKIFVAQNLLLSLLISVLTLLGALVFVDMANDILIISFTAITKATIANINIISFNIKLVLLAISATMLLGVCSTAVPLVLLHRIKPINIIKAKE